MTGADIVITGAAGAAALLLLLAGIGHLRERRLFAATLDAQRMLPHGIRPVVAHVMGPLEAALGMALLAGLVTGGPLARAAAAGTAALYLAFGAYVALVWRLRPRVPCGCFGSSAPASGTTVARAALLGIAATALAFRGMPRPHLADSAVVWAAALVLTGVFWLLPLLTER